ncbi:hypothetical protein ACH5RR_023331 [Cinchona calisaya]|uniref:Reverse transcriptase domain-containing protein n=1 Tax=Cinchona calisaya TaxID=153742 RepID=A0ABD2ZBW2_9GENT
MHEMVKGYNRGDGSARYVVKVDIMKAYDSLRWDFLFCVLELMRFPPKFINWLRLGVQTAMFSLNLNGALTGYFPSSQGLRQGDLVSPYLFILAMVVFSLLLDY